MSKEKKKKESILKSGFFLKLFGVPSICISFLGIGGMFLPDEPGEEPTTWLDFFEGMLIILIIWFAISFVVSLIVNEIKKSKPKTKIVKEIQYMTQSDEKIVARSEKLKEETKKTSRKKSNDKYLYTCESKVDAYEYKKMAKYFPQMYWTYVIWGTLGNLIITSIIAILSRSFITTFIFFVVYQIYIMILYKVRLEHVAEKSFNFIQKKGNIDYDIHMEFYDDYFIRKDEIETLKINYDDIDRCVETDTNFYLKFGKRNKIIIIQKNLCDLELISFIRQKFNNLENHLGDKSNFKGVKRYHNPNFIRTFMIILFVITICSLWGALWTAVFVDKLNPQHEFSFIKNTWVFWCWLPVPLLSIILGCKYKNAGFKCTKNIVGGIIIALLLLVYGSFSLYPVLKEGYSNIYQYEDILGINIPEKPISFDIMEYHDVIEKNKSNFITMTVKYNYEDNSNIILGIESNPNWVSSINYDKNMKEFLSSTFKKDKHVYYSIYNETTKEYNVLPKTDGKYKIIGMFYNTNYGTLYIQSYDIEYKVKEK